MPIYRAYTQPDNPVIYTVLGLDAREEDDQLKYSRQLKTACLLSAGPQPRAPPICPRCHQFSTFHSRLCYKYGLAGAWNMICQKCNKVHIPTQEGPKEKDLEGIEAIRDRDRQTHRARKEAKERTRDAKKLAAKEKKPRDRATQKVSGTKTTKDEPASKRAWKNVVEDKRPFESISNAMQVEEPMRDERSQTVLAGRVPRQGNSVTAASCVQGGRSQAYERSSPNSNVEEFDSELRTIVLVLWEKSGELPFIDRIDVERQDDLFLFHHPRVRAIPSRPPTVYKRFVFIGKIWSAVPWDISPIEVQREDDVIFVRVSGVQCRGFGQQLYDYQLQRGLALPLGRRLDDVIYHPPPRHRWILVWDEDRGPPKIFLFDSRLIDDPETAARVARPWLELLRDAPFFLIWHELHTRWQGVLRGQASHVPDDSPIILLALPGAENLQGSGEAIAWLETWRDEHGYAQPNARELFDLAARPNSSLTAPAVPLRACAKRKRTHSSPGSGSEDEPESDAARVPNTSSKSVSTVDKRTPNKLKGHTRASSPIIIWDEGEEFVQGSSATPVKPRRRGKRGVELDVQGREVIDLTDI